MQCLRLHAAPSATADRARRAKFPPCGSILIRAAQTRRQRPQPSHPRSQGAGKRRFVIAESAEGLRVVGEAPAASPRWPRSAAHHCVRLSAPAALQYSPLFVRCADPSAAAGSKKFSARARESDIKTNAIDSQVFAVEIGRTTRTPATAESPPEFFFFSLELRREAHKRLIRARRRLAK